MTGAWMLAACLLGGIASRDLGKVQAKNRVDCNSTDEGLEGDRECLQETGLSGWSSHCCHGSVGDLSGDRVCM